jgi:transposase
MKPNYVSVDRQTPMLLPVDLRDWVRPDDMVHFVIQVIEDMTLPSLHVNHRGSGSPQFPPKMMLSLLVYCYANGIFGSRRIEAATYQSVPVRYLTGDTHPDHATICKFRTDNFAAIGEAFLEVLKLAKEMNVLKVGTISIDGTHIRSNASRYKNVEYGRAGELINRLDEDIKQLKQEEEEDAKLRSLVDDRIGKAEQEDKQDHDSGQSLPDEIKRREALKDKLQKAREAIERRVKTRYEAEQAEYERKMTERAADPKPGRPPNPPKEEIDPKERINLTDEDSRAMKKSTLGECKQAYNAQAVVDAEGSQLVVGHHISQCSNDSNELKPALDSVDAKVVDYGRVVADSGYANKEVIKEIQGTENGPDLYIAIGGDGVTRRYDFRPEDPSCESEHRILDPVLVGMREKVRSENGKAIYKLRKQSSEPVFGIIKSAMGFGQFLLRGLDKVSGEWSLVTTAYNFKRLWGLCKGHLRG